jgi:hypothetical protein
MTDLTDDEMKLAYDTWTATPGVRAGLRAVFRAVLAQRAPKLDPDRLVNAVRAGCAAPAGCGYPGCAGGRAGCARPAIIARALAADDVWWKAHGLSVAVDAGLRERMTHHAMMAHKMAFQAPWSAAVDAVLALLPAQAQAAGPVLGDDDDRPDR